MEEYLPLLMYLTLWIFLYHFIIIPKTAEAAFETWQKRLEDDRQLILDITAPVLEEIESMLESRFQSFWGSISQLGQKAQDMNPANDMKKAIKSGDLYSILAEYITGKAGLGSLSSLIKTKQGQNELDDGPELGRL